METWWQPFILLNRKVDILIWVRSPDIRKTYKKQNAIINTKKKTNLLFRNVYLFNTGKYFSKKSYITNVIATNMKHNTIYDNVHYLKMYIYLTLGKKVIDDSIRVNYQFCWFSQDFSSNTFAHSIWSDEDTDTLLYQQICNMKHIQFMSTFTLKCISRKHNFNQWHCTRETYVIYILVHNSQHKY